LTETRESNINIGMALPTSFSYAVVESALAKAVGIPASDRPAFAARLRHLRNLGVPKTKPGSGKRLSYARSDVEQMFVALLLESLGCSPTVSVKASEVATRRRTGHNRISLALFPRGKIVLVSAETASALTREEVAVVLVNLDSAAAKLGAALTTETHQGASL